MLALILMAGMTLFPLRHKRWLVYQIKMLELRTGITGILLLGLVFYWLARLLFFREAFMRLIAG